MVDSHKEEIDIDEANNKEPDNVHMDNLQKRTLFDHFCVVGQTDDDSMNELSINDNILAPIIDIEVVFTRLSESIRDGFEGIMTTPTGLTADLHHGSFPANGCFLAIRRGYHKAPFVDIGILDKSKNESVKSDSYAIMQTRYGNHASVSNSSSDVFITYRRAKDNFPTNIMVVTDICVINASKNERPPPSYFKIDTPLNRGMIGSDIYICYRKAPAIRRQLRYKPIILDSFPSISHLPAIQELPKFLMPRGATIEAWPSLVDQPSDSMSTFVLTDENGTKLYGTVLTFYEKYQKKLSEDQLIKLNLKNSENENKYINDTELTQKEDILRESGEKNDRTSTSLDLYEHQSEVATKITEFELYKNLAICIISKYPFFDSFCNVLRTLKKMVCENTHSNYSIERYISFLMYEVIYPAPRYPRIKLTLQKNAISFLSNDASELPLTGASFVDCLRVMGPSNLMVAVLYMLTEGKILFHSMRPYLLTTVSESVCALMFPFFWQCGYVPQCPLETVEVFECPVPIIAGVDSNYFEMVESQPADVVCFGLDTSTTSVTQSQIKKLIDEMPPKAVKVLTNGLNEIFKNVASEDKKLETLRATANYQLLTEVEKERAFKNREFNLKIRQVFLRFMCKLMDGYGTCIKPITKDPYRNENMDTSEIFDIEKFISSKGKKEFYKKMMQTQYFSRFIEERVFLSDKNEFYLFFDNCMVKNRTMPDEDLFDHNLPKILNDTIVDYDPTIPSEFEGKSYYYPQFPTSFKKENFCLEYVNALVGVKDALGELSEDPTNRNLNVVRCLYEYEFERSFTKHFMEQSQLYGPKFILFHTFSLWFTLLPSYLEKTSKKLNGLALAFFYLDKFKQMKLPIIDQQVFRVLIHQCGVFGKPYWALKALRVLIDMGETPDAITLPIYHKAVTARGWPSEQQLKAYKRFKGAAWSVIVCNYFTKAFIKNSIPTNDAEDYNDVTSVSNSNTKTSLAISSTPNNVMTKSENLLSSGSISVIADETNEVENKCKSFATKWEEFELSNEKNIPITHSLYSPNSLFQHFTDETISEVTKYTTQYPKLDKLVKEFKVKKGNFKTRCVVHELERDIIQINNMYEDCLTKYCVDYAPSINHVNSKDIIENLIKDPYVSSFGENCSLKDNNTESIPPSMTSSNYDETSQIEIKINEEEKREFEIKNENIVFESEPLGVEGPNKMFDNPLSVTCKNEEIEPDVVDHQKSRERFIAEHEKVPFALDITQKSPSRNERGLMSKSWIKAVTNSPIVSRLLRSHTSNDVSSDDVPEKSFPQTAQMHMSPSFTSYLLKSVRDSAKKVIEPQKVHKLKTGFNYYMEELSNNNPFRSSLDITAPPKNLILTPDQEREHFNQFCYELGDGNCQNSKVFNKYFVGFEDYISIYPSLVQTIGKYKRIDLCIASKCDNCGNINYDEDILSNMTEQDDSSLFKCFHCISYMTPALIIKTVNGGKPKKNSYYCTNDLSKNQNSNEDSIKAPSWDVRRFLSIVYLRLAVECQIMQCPKANFSGPGFVLDQPLLFYNMLYYFRRANLFSHINYWSGMSTQICCVYDIPNIHNSPSMPLYIACKDEFCNEDNQEAKAGIKKLLETIVLGLRNDDLNKAMSLYRNKLRGYQNKNDLHTGATFPMYRDFLFVALERYGMLVDRNEFDFKYRAEFEMISPTVISKLPTKDYPPKLMNMACRRIFIPLDLN